jgi:mRNA-degrading endonuclease RelE of RelBE toxin-antitoxin system
MAYRVELTARAVRDLRRIGAKVPEDASLRQIQYGNKPNFYRIIYAVEEAGQIVRVLHIRHGARQSISTGGAR